MVEDTGPKAEATVASVGGSNSAAGPAANPDALVAEATRLLKGVSLRAMSCDFEGDLTWIRSALASASNPEFCLVDSGATNALRPASLEELGTCRRIHVDLASGGTELMINECGTLLHNGPRQVILPANYLVQLGFSIVWKKRGCRIRHPKKGVLEVTVVKGCPLISREVGLALLRDVEERRNGTPVLSKAEATDLQVAMTPSQAGVWLRDRLALREKGLTDVDQLVFMRGMFPGVPIGVLARVCVQALNESMVDWTDLPWNRRFRRSMSRASPGSALVVISPGQRTWKGLGKVISVSTSERGLGSRVVFQLLLRWAESGKIGGVVQGEGLTDLEEKVTGFSWDGVERKGDDWRVLVQGSVDILRLFLLFSVAQARRDLDTGEQALVKGFEKDPQGLEGKGRGHQAPAPSGIPSRGDKSGVDRSLVFLACGLPSDPRRGVLEGGLKQGWDPTSMEAFSQAYSLNRASFDSACFGANYTGASELLTSSWFLYEATHAIRMGSTTKAIWELTRPERPRNQAGSTEGWARGLLRVVQGAWCSWCALGCRSEEVSERKAWLAKVVSDEAYAKHVSNDHIPYLKGCPVCIRAQGRQRSHWRSGFPGVHSASFDIAGRLCPARPLIRRFQDVIKGRGTGTFWHVPILSLVSIIRRSRGMELLKGYLY